MWNTNDESQKNSKLYSNQYCTVVKWNNNIDIDYEATNDVNSTR